MGIATRAAVPIAAVLLLGGCATVSHGTTQAVEMRSQPPGAEVATSIGGTCITPCTLILKRKTGFVATIRKAGYQPLSITVSSVDSGGRGAVVRTALTTGLVGYLVDRGNGALRELKPNPVEVTLTPEPPSRP